MDGPICRRSRPYLGAHPVIREPLPLAVHVGVSISWPEALRLTVVVDTGAEGAGGAFPGGSVRFSTVSGTPLGPVRFLSPLPAGAVRVESIAVPPDLPALWVEIEAPGLRIVQALVSPQLPGPGGPWDTDPPSGPRSHS